MWRPLPYVGGGRLVPLLQDLREGFQKAPASLRYKSGNVAFQGEVCRQEEATGAGLLFISPL